jgi:uncharacterized protein YjdB
LVATVSSSGLVRAVAPGTAVITVTTNDGNKQANCNITVSSNVTGVSLNITSQDMSINQTLQLTATVQPSNATDKSVSWSSSNASVATVSSSGLVKAVAPGMAVITVTTNDGNKRASCNITVSSDDTGNGYIDLDAAVHIYPNPANSAITIENMPSDARVIQIFNLAGHLVYSHDVQNSLKSSVNLNISSFSAGIYIIKVGNYRVKLVKK